MANEFLVNFDKLLNDILTDYSNLDSNPDTSEGTMTYIKAACLASMLWGLYRYQDYIARQIFPDTADTDNLNRHGAVLGITRSPSDTDATYLQKILNFLRKPPAGGNANDWANWCKYDEDGNLIVTTTNLDSDGDGYFIESAKIITPPEVSPGTVDCVVVPNDEDILDTAAETELLNLIEDNIESLRPVTSNEFTVQMFEPKYETILMYVSGDNVDTGVIEDDITAYMNTLEPGQPLYESKLIALALDNGANNVTSIFTTPDSFDSTNAIRPTKYEAVRPLIIVVDID